MMTGAMLMDSVAQGERTQPFPGLRPFEPEEAHLFFGRERQVDDLLLRLGRSRFTAVVGSSGSGKSSLVRAGLLPALAAGYLASAGSHWKVALMRPGGSPIRHLAVALAQPEVLGPSMPREWPAETVIEATLRRSSLGLLETVSQAHLAQGENLLIVVDQFEEIFRLRSVDQTRAGEEAASFIKLLLEALGGSNPSLYLMLTMRSDFLGHCPQFRGLPEALNDCQYLVPRMTRQQIREGITGPVAVAGGAIESRLVQRILNDLGDDPDQLPVLQHALMRTWNLASQRSYPPNLVMDDYTAIGGLQDALGHHADEIYNELPSLGLEQRVARVLFQTLTEKQLDQPETRRPSLLRDITAVAGVPEQHVAKVIDRFRLAGRTFLMPPIREELTGDSIIDISHEALIRQWDRLRGWVKEAAEAGATFVRILDAARRYEARQASLYRDPELTGALEWRRKLGPNPAWVRRYVPQDPEPAHASVMRFLDRSRAARTRKLLIRLGVVVLVGVSLAGWTVQYLRSKQLALEAARQTIQKQEKQALVKEAAIATYRTQRTVTSQVTMFERTDQDRQLAGVLRELGFIVEARPSVGPGTATNALWFGTLVPLWEVKLAANALLKADVRLDHIRPFASTSARHASNVMQVGSDRALSSCPPWDQERVAAAQTFARSPVCEPPRPSQSVGNNEK
jgi:hypothetical protein